MLDMFLKNNIGVKLKKIFYNLYIIECILGVLGGIIAFIMVLFDDPLLAFLFLLSGCALPFVLLPFYYICYGFAQIVHRAEVGNSEGSFVINETAEQNNHDNSKIVVKTWTEHMNDIGEYLVKNAGDEISVKEVKLAARACRYNGKIAEKELEYIQNYLDKHS
jgi:hypothetical protein